MISYNICTVGRFNNKHAYSRPVQAKLEGFEENPRSRYELLEEHWKSIPNQPGKGETTIVAQYRGLQDVVRNRYGFVHGKEFFSYLEPHEFEMYYVDSQNIAVFNVGKDPVSAFVKSMTDDHASGFELERLEIDFQRLMPLIEVISGAWFADIDKQFLKSAGFFAPHVDRSEEFKAAAKAGKIQQLHFEYMFEGIPYKVALTRTGGVLLFNRIGDPRLKKYDISKELDLVLDVYNKYLQA